MSARWRWGALVVAAAGCVWFPRRVEVPTDREPTVMVASVSMPEPIARVARHAWIAGRRAGGSWQRWECCFGGQFGNVSNDSTEAPLAPGHQFHGDVAVHGVWRGQRALEAMDCLDRESAVYEHRGTYTVWPGPNSNTYVDAMLRRCGLHASLPATAIGRDYRGPIGLSVTSEGTGFQFETPLVGLRMGLTEGVEVHVLGLVFGVDLWPPALILPFGIGRLGFADR